MNVDELMVSISVSIIEREKDMEEDSWWGSALWRVKERDPQRNFELLIQNTRNRLTKLARIQWH